MRMVNAAGRLGLASAEGIGSGVREILTGVALRLFRNPPRRRRNLRHHWRPGHGAGTLYRGQS